MEGFLTWVPPPWEVPGWSLSLGEICAGFGGSSGVGARAAHPAGSISGAWGWRRRGSFLLQPPCARLTPRVLLPRFPRSRWVCLWWNHDGAPFNSRASVQGGGPGTVSSSGHCAVDIPVTGAVLVSRVQRGAPRDCTSRGEALRGVGLPSRPSRMTLWLRAPH